MANSLMPIAPQSTYALAGTIVTMNAQRRVIPNGILYIENGTIVHVLDESTPNPDSVKWPRRDLIKVGGTIYPGLIELHNHLSYNVLPLWDVPKQFLHRGLWKDYRDYYRRLVSGPMAVLGNTPGYLEAIVRYVECKCLFGGVTTSQGITLYNVHEIEELFSYQGLVRNVEKPNDSQLPNAHTRIDDVGVNSVESFFTLLQSRTCQLLHLSEGNPTNDTVNKHFKALKLPGGNDQWAITDALAGIHATGLRSADFEILAANKGAIVWSPLSNLLLYGVTTDMAKAKSEGILSALGSDWSITGSKNLLCELKVAQIVSNNNGNIFSAEELVKMATINPAKILKWDHLLGSLEAGKKADLVVVRNTDINDVYQHLINARETSINLVAIDGIPRYGQRRIMEKFSGPFETVEVGESERLLYLNNFAQNPIIVDISLKEARDKLTSGLKNIQSLAEKLETYGSFAMGVIDISRPSVRWGLETEHELSSGFLDLAYGMENNYFPNLAAEPLSQILKPIQLDPDTIANDGEYFNHLGVQLNLPAYVKQTLPIYYGESPIASSRIDQKVSRTPGQSFEVLGGTISKFLEGEEYLSKEEQIRIVEEAAQMLKETYVHLDLKSSMHAANPLDQLTVLKGRAEIGLNDREFHQEMIHIFNSLRDLHTTYILPSPFHNKVAILPYFIEEYYDADGKARYIITKLLNSIADRPFPDSFKEGVEVLYWNGVPIRNAIQFNGKRFAGSNEAARFARGLDALTFRPLSKMLPPQADWIVLQYRDDETGKVREFKHNWKILDATARQEQFRIEEAMTGMSTHFGYDPLSRLLHQLKREFLYPVGFIPSAEAVEESVNLYPDLEGAVETHLPSFFKGQTLKIGKKIFGYIRIFSFNIKDHEFFVKEFVRLLEKMKPKDGLIIDVRANGGGNIYACERLLKTLKKEAIPQNAQFIRSEIIEYICDKHSPSNQFRDLNLGPWKKGLELLQQTGERYSTAHPITPNKLMVAAPRQYKGPVVLIVDALCYSATDIFAASFQDHGIGNVLGIHENTGAGGANVWTYSLLRTLTLEDKFKSKFFRPLPKGANFTVAIRRMLRSGRGNSGVPLENLGVKPDYQHNMTKKDLLNNNKDLIDKAISILQRGLTPIEGKKSKR